MFNEINMAPVMDMRKRFQEKLKRNTAASWVSCFFCHCCSCTGRNCPVLNAPVDGNIIVYHGYFDIGIAVARLAAWWFYLAQCRPDELCGHREKIAEYGASVANLVSKK
jgi:2-oxoglutarate dehydrogenase E2 component (dihydrolipoamide succinyltransferase)